MIWGIFSTDRIWAQKQTQMNNGQNRWSFLHTWLTWAIVILMQLHQMMMKTCHQKEQVCWFLTIMHILHIFQSNDGYILHRKTQNIFFVSSGGNCLRSLSWIMLIINSYLFFSLFFLFAFLHELMIEAYLYQPIFKFYSDWLHSLLPSLAFFYYNRISANQWELLN